MFKNLHSFVNAYLFAQPFSEVVPTNGHKTGNIYIKNVNLHCLFTFSKIIDVLLWIDYILQDVFPISNDVKMAKHIFIFLSCCSKQHKNYFVQ